MQTPLHPLEAYYTQQEEPVRECLLFLRGYILAKCGDITEVWKYAMPFFCYKGKMFCYLWVHKKHGLPYIGFVEGRRMQHPGLLVEDRARMAIYLIDPAKDMPVVEIDVLLKEALAFYT